MDQQKIHHDSYIIHYLRSIIITILSTDFHILEKPNAY